MNIKDFKGWSKTYNQLLSYFDNKLLLNYNKQGFLFNLNK